MSSILCHCSGRSNPLCEGISAHMAMSIWFNSPNRAPTPPLAPGGPGPHMGRNLCPHRAPHGPPWAPYGAKLLLKGATWAPWAPMGRIRLQALQGNCSVPRRGVFFLPENDFLSFWIQKLVKKKLRLSGVDLSGEFRSGILCKTPPRMFKMLGWRPIRCKFCVAWGPLEFRAQLAHPWALGQGLAKGAE